MTASSCCARSVCRPMARTWLLKCGCRPGLEEVLHHLEVHIVLLLKLAVGLLRQNEQVLVVQFVILPLQLQGYRILILAVR